MGDKNEDSVEEVEVEESGGKQGSGDAPGKSAVGDISSQVMQNPQVLAALQERLDGLVGKSTGYIENLPKVVKRRVKALKNLQVKYAKTEAKFYEEVHELECKYAALYQSLYEKRKDVVIGAIEPTDSDCEWQSSDEEEDDEENELLADEMKKKASLEEKEKVDEKEEENPNGIPEFWLTIFKNVDMLSEMVQEHDEPILKCLENIHVKFSEPGQPMGFTLEFHFAANDYFTNKVLTKYYSMRSEPDESDPFSFEGPEIVSCTGCTIDWKKGKNITVKVIKKKQKHKGRGTTRTVTKTVQNDSFFNFFNPPQVPEDGEMDEETEVVLAADFEIGHFFRERVIPKAVLYFTGEAIEDDDEYEEEGEEEVILNRKSGDADGEEGDDDDDNDPEYDPSKDGQKPSECKQQ
ncbi:nucleosome assembly protein 1-like 1 isoform X2 [Saccoglossus kowalevskii]|uniref:Nucleosome assembly protein 1-like 1-like isoform X1 n=1 Tax=Saccoglossus kowalevskii TaxID=10224 RepID=A0ABM0LTT8_SACKO|nr:PREDICTED: nucleosome assembly protein 1-like 1-like isoform X1 [Saccoglossus kowalevskii]